MKANEAAQETRRLTLPPSPDKYETLLPKDFELPKGQDGKPIPFEFDQSDPRLSPLRSLMHEIDQGKVSGQDAFSRLLAIHAQHELAEDSRIATARKAEIDKLGANGSARVDAAETQLIAMVGTDGGKALLERMVLASDFEHLENLLKKFSSQDNTSYSDSHRERPAQGLTEEQYLAMTPGERLAHTRRVEASKQVNGRAA